MMIRTGVRRRGGGGGGGVDSTCYGRSFHMMMMRGGLTTRIQSPLPRRRQLLLPPLPHRSSLSNRSRPNANSILPHRPSYLPLLLANSSFSSSSYSSLLPKVTTTTTTTTTTTVHHHHHYYHYDSIRWKSSMAVTTTYDDDNDPMIIFPSSRTSMLMEVTDRVGVLHDILRYFWKYDVNLCRIESRPGKDVRTFDFFVDMDGSYEDNDHIQKVYHALQQSNDVNQILLLDVASKDVHWFPWHIREIDMIANRILDAGQDLDSDHPGFHDPIYRSRRAQLAQHALNYTLDMTTIPNIDYTTKEISVWTAVWDRMESLWDSYACSEYVDALTQMQQYCGYNRFHIPQQQDISTYLYERTGFRIRPVAGLLSSRDFLNALAFRIFCATQYIRHESQPFYTPEPDVIHELLGHAPMLSDHDFADFSQQIGLASLGASDEDIIQLARCYWYTVEFGLCRDEHDGRYKAYGAGLLSSFGELEYSCGGSSDDGQPQYQPWDPIIASQQEFPITTYQPIYYVAESLRDAKEKMRTYCNHLSRPFMATYHKENQSIRIDRPVQRTKGDIPNHHHHYKAPSSTTNMKTTTTILS